MKVVIITVLTIAVAVLSWADGLDDTWEFRPQVFWYEDPPRARTMYYLPADITERMQYITHLVFIDEAFLTVYQSDGTSYPGLYQIKGVWPGREHDGIDYNAYHLQIRAPGKKDTEFLLVQRSGGGPVLTEAPIYCPVDVSVDRYTADEHTGLFSVTRSDGSPVYLGEPWVSEQ